MASFHVVCWAWMVYSAVACGSPTDPGTSDFEQRGASMILSPASATLAMRERRQFEVTVLDRRGRATDAEVQWQATGGTITPDGLYTAGSSVGTYDVIARNGRLSASATVRIVEAGNGPDNARVETSITVNPGSVELEPGGAQLFTAQVRDQNGEPMDTAVTWEAEGGTITATGLYTAGNQPGSYQVSAQSEDLSATASIVIDQPSPPPPPPSPPSPPPPSPGTDVEMLGAWGCSQVTNEWRAFDRHPAPFGTWSGFNWGGAELEVWHTALGNPNGGNWADFQAMVDLYPETTDLYAEICISDPFLFSEASLQQMAEDVF
ncbi:MAG: hypothetical protein ACREK3_00170, partial [Gemmatimonadota bacterium]